MLVEHQAVVRAHFHLHREKCALAYMFTAAQCFQKALIQNSFTCSTYIDNQQSAFDYRCDIFLLDHDYGRL